MVMDFLSLGKFKTGTLKEKFVGDSFIYGLNLGFNFVVLTLSLSLLWRSMDAVSMGQYPLIQMIGGGSIVLFELGLSSTALRFHLLKQAVMPWCLKYWLGGIAFFFPAIYVLLFIGLVPHVPGTLILLTLMYGISFSFFQISMAFLRSQRNLKVYSTLSISKNLIILGVLFYFYHHGVLSLYHWLCTLIIVHLPMGVWALLKSKRKEPLQPTILPKEIFQLSGPIWIAGLLAFSDTFIDILFIKIYYPVDLVDYRIAVEYTLLFTGLSQLLQLSWPTLALEGLHQQGKSILLNKLPQLLKILGGYMFLLGLLCGPLLSVYLGNPASPKTIWFASLALASSLFVVLLIFIRPYFEFNKTSNQILIASTLGIFINLMGNFFFVKTYGGTAALLSSILGYLTVFLTLFFKMGPNRQTILRLFGWFLALLSLFLIAVPYIKP